MTTPAHDDAQEAPAPAPAPAGPPGKNELLLLALASLAERLPDIVDRLLLPDPEVLRERAELARQEYAASALRSVRKIYKLAAELERSGATGTAKAMLEQVGRLLDGPSVGRQADDIVELRRQEERALLLKTRSQGKARAARRPARKQARKPKGEAAGPSAGGN